MVDALLDGDAGHVGFLWRAIRRGCVPRRDAEGQHLERRRRLVASVTVPSRDNAVVLSDVELVAV